MSKNHVLLLLLVSYLLLTSFYSYLNLGNSILNLNIMYSKRREIKIFCLILTTQTNLKSKAKIIFDSWARKCDEHRFVAMLPQKQMLTNVSHEIKYENLFDVLQPSELQQDSYGQLTHKVYAAFRHVFNRFPDFDWYLKADDDSFMLMDNMRQFLANKNQSQPITYGYNMKILVDKGYHSG